MYEVDRIVGCSARMKEVRDLIQRVADSSCNLLITGERGTGKELVAKVIHHISGRKTASFVPVACSAISEADWESDIFEEADNGTLFFDEIGQLPLLLQTKLAQILEHKKCRLAEQAQSVTVDVRVIASTALNLEHEVNAKRFREDLYYGLKVVEVDLPSLRDRPEDIPLLAESFLTRYSHEYSKPVREIGEPARVLLMHYSWPGNVRELESVIERAVTLSHTREIVTGDLPASIQQAGGSGLILSKGIERARTLQQVEWDYIRLILEKSGGNRYEAAEILGIDRETLYRKIAEMEKAGAGE